MKMKLKLKFREFKAQNSPNFYDFRFGFKILSNRVYNL